MAITVKDFAKTLKIPDKALIERMQKAGLSHSKSSDEITPSDKQALLKFLKGTKTTSSKSNAFWTSLIIIRCLMVMMLPHPNFHWWCQSETNY